MIERTDIFKITISTSDEAHQEIIIAFADSIGIDAIEQTNDSLIIHSEKKELIEQLTTQLIELDLSTEDDLIKETIKNQNWNATWEKSFTPIVINNFCAVRASFHESPKNVAHEIIINPELAFGTGHHETTYMMIDQMSDMPLLDKSIFDYGCGTAILSILAEKLGASHIFGIDIEDQAIECAQNCVELNGSKNIRLEVGTLDIVPVLEYDIILANINKGVLMNSGEGLSQRCAPGGFLLLSGILKGDDPKVIHYYREYGFDYKRIMYKGEWSSILMKKA